MKNFSKKLVLTSYINSITCTCDVCKKKYTDMYEIQEFYTINLVGGYRSVFGEGNEVNVDLCQHCLKVIIDKHVEKL